jgi:RNA polymerase sigma-70 factor (ECF subfamily)
MLLHSLPADDHWTRDFHTGKSATMAGVYREHFETVRAAVATILFGADCETVVHEVFFRLLSNESLRHSYQSGAFAGWLFTVAKNQAIDYARRRARETPDGLVPSREAADFRIEHQLEARALIRKFREEVLPEEWRSVFEARFVRQLEQREAARVAGVPRTTLAYRELRIRRLLRSFLLKGTLSDGLT